MGFPSVFINMVNLIFHNACACVKVNGAHSPVFQIERGFRQKCPLAPYIFIILTDVLNIMVQAKVILGRVKGISLPIANRQQILAEYADDTSFTLLGDEESVRNLI